jgi:hypothetical protein
MNAKSALKLSSIALCAVLLPGCYTTTVSSGKPAAPARIEYDEKWHHGVVYGIAELSGPYDLEAACPAGWAEITTETSFANGFVDAITYGIYSPQRVTVRCALPSKPVATLPAVVAAAAPAAPSSTSLEPPPAAGPPAEPAKP